MNIRAFHRVTWDQKQEIIVIGAAEETRTTRGLWIADCDGGAVLVWNNKYHGAFPASPEGAEKLRLVMTHILHPSRRDEYRMQWKIIEKEKGARVSPALWLTDAHEKEGSDARSDGNQS